MLGDLFQYKISGSTDKRSPIASNRKKFTHSRLSNLSVAMCEYVIVLKWLNTLSIGVLFTQDSRPSRSLVLSIHAVLSLLTFALTIPYCYYRTLIKINTTQCPHTRAHPDRRTQFRIRSEWNECEIACNWAYIVSHANYTIFFLHKKGSVIEWNDRVVSVEVHSIRLLAPYVLFFAHSKRHTWARRLSPFTLLYHPFNVKLAFSWIRDFCTVDPIELVVRKQFIKFNEMYISFQVKVTSSPNEHIQHISLKSTAFVNGYWKGESLSILRLNVNSWNGTLSQSV